MKPMCWVRDFYDDLTEQWYVEYCCKAWRRKEGYTIVKLKSSHAPECFKLCEEEEK